MGKSRQQELVAADHMVPTVRKQREVNASLIPSSPFPFLQFKEMVPPMISGSSHLINIIKTVPYEGPKHFLHFTFQGNGGGGW